MRLCKTCKKKRPTYGTIQGSPIHCGDCKKDEEFNVKHKMCEMCKKKQPSFGTIQGKPIHCGDCKKDEEFDVKNKRCKAGRDVNYPDAYPCEILATRKLKGLCAMHCAYFHPDIPVSRRFKSRERRVIDFIRKMFPHEEIIHDRRVDGGCSMRRPDALIDKGTFSIIVEVDENQHAEYDCTCENKRNMQLFQDLGSRPLIFIRFNPDAYFQRDGKKVTGCWGETKMGYDIKPSKIKEWSDRLNVLYETLKGYLTIAGDIDREIEVISLFFDEN